VAVKQRAFQGTLQSALPGIEVTTVGRVGDFDRALKGRPDAVLTLPVVLNARGLPVSVRGRFQGSWSEPYVLLASDVAPELVNVQRVGALDLLGRDGTNAFIAGLVGARPKAERVTKVEDLLPLLQLQRVDAILLAERLVDGLRLASRLLLTERILKTKVELPAAASLSAAGAHILSALRELPSDVCGALGVDEWD